MAVLAEMSWGEWFMVMTVIGVCSLLMLIILVQRGRGEGLTGAFGGGGSSAFGAKTGDVFTWITVVGTVIFLFVAVVANFALDQTPTKAVPVSGVSAPPSGEGTVPGSEGGIEVDLGLDEGTPQDVPPEEPAADPSEDAPAP